ncbi:MAG: cytochrome c [Vulcanimicrobiota bacterium]
MKRLILLAVAALAVGCGQPQTPATATAPANSSAAAPSAAAIDLDKAAQDYKQSCAACHGQDAKGVPNLGKDLVDSEFVVKTSDDDLVAFVKKGRGTDDPANTSGVAMPPKGGNPALQDTQLRGIVAYLRSLHP